MPTYAALYRALNVGRRRVRMADLAAVHASLGQTDVRTYLASGNVVFRTGARSRDALVRTLETAFARAVGFKSEVILRDADELAVSIDRNPYLEAGLESRFAHTLFLRDLPDPERVGAFLSEHEGPEEVTVTDRDVYIYFPDGAGQSRLDLTAFGAPATARNANTVAALLELMRR